MITNYLFRLLFDYRGSISRREYWAGIVAAFMCFSIYMQDFFGPSLFMTKIFESKYEFGIINNTLIHPILENSFFVTFPFLFAAFYIFINITVKRGRTLNFSLAKSVFIGFFSYLVSSGIFGVTYYLSIISTGSFYEGYFVYNNVDIMKSIPVFLAIIMIIGIGCLIYMSFCKTEQDHAPTNKNYDTLNTLIYIGQLMLIFVIISILLISVLTLNINNEYELNNTIIVFMSFVSLLFACMYIYILVKRSKDAGIKPIFIVIAILSVIVIFGLISLCIKTEFFIGLPVMNLLKNWVLLIINILTFVLIALPGKVRNNIIEKI